MRKTLCALIVAVVMAIPAGIGLATASFRQSATVALTDDHAGAARAGASVGLNVKLVATDAGAPGGKPKAAKRVVIAFPGGTRFNLRTSVGRVCSLTDAQIKKPFGPTCPVASQIGRGAALLNTNPMGVVLTQVKAPLVATVRANVHAYVHAGNRMIIVLYLNMNDLPGAAPIILHGHASGHSLTVDIPRLIYGKSKKPKFAGVTAAIVSLKLTAQPTGSGSHALVRAGTCDQGKYVVTSHFTYFDGSPLVVRSTSRCSP